MGKHYCDYCDVFLTHDSVSVRKAHNSGRNHLQNVREYYQNLDPDQIQQVLDTLAAEYDKRSIEKPRDLLQPAGSSFMTFGAGPLSGTSDRAFRSQAPPRMSVDGAGGGRGGPDRGGGSRGGSGGYGRYGINDGSTRDHGAPPNYNRPPPQGGLYSRPPPNMVGSGASGGSSNPYPPRGPPSGYSAIPPGPYGSGPSPNMRGPPPSLLPNGSYPHQSRSGYGR
ncbi:probable U1 small nuclear ribonucleoprotein C [Melanopsichium pennsylvanicum]|uniref:U1 small nuclear ribonucleoprotein C n=2 Tax=Melanopsichium pennsylvanicum TaxID=63383 RepID=A0AAJ5C7I2_9BASI|nr:related to U1 small nuclear ribonucleoprotein C [Melanopsichium pennsylvanicum 4]SNX86564.1 probable U1 small nuclear ribonucleoprotein C [Melanopsichium pennsylvanicum]